MEQILVKDQNDKEPTYTLASPEEIVAAIASLGVIPRHFVITGGEPCLYDLRPLTALLLTHGSVQIETSGTMEIQADPQTWVTVSPKVDMPGGLQVLPSSLARANEVKMPVESMEDIENLLALEGEIDGTIWLQPVSQGKAATDLCVDCCHRFGWRLSIQSHKYIGLR
jgi:7-carboxy-7-deazaguanine synthase